MTKIQYIIYGIIIMTITLFLWGVNSETASLTHLKIMGIVGIVQLAVSIFGWYRVQRTIFNPYVVFLCACYVFCFGQSMLIPFDAISEKRDLLNTFTINNLFNAQAITLIFLGAMHLGALASLKQKLANLYSLPSTKSQLEAIKYIGWIFFTISIIPFILELWEKISIVGIYGYGGLYTEMEVKVGVDGIRKILSSYTLPSLVCLYIAYHNKSDTTKKIFYIFFIFYTLVTMYIGGRSEGVVLVVILLLLYHYYDKPIKFKRFMVVAVIGYFFLSLLSVVAMIRTQSMLGLSDYVEAFKSSDNMGQETISEMGWSMYPLASTLNIVPDLYPYRYGASYLYALSSIIPNFGFWELHPAMVNANLGDWLQRENNLSFGPGYSIVAEAYLNFGYFGGIFLFLFGYVISKLFQMVNVNNIRKNPIIIVCALVFCFFLFKIPRNSFLALVRAFFYYIVPLYVYVVYFHKRIFYKK